MIIIHSERKKHKYLQILKAGGDYKLSFTRQEVFGNLILSVDKIRKRLMVSDLLNPLKLFLNIELDKIRFIGIKKVYKDIQRGQLKHNNLAHFLESIHFQLVFMDGSRELLLPIFERKRDDQVETGALESKAVLWQMMISKLKLQ